MSSIASPHARWTQPAPQSPGSFVAGAGHDGVSDLASEHARLLRRVGVLTRARLAGSNITLLVARIWDNHESEPSDRVAPSASTISEWVQQARILDDPSLH